MNDPLLEFRVIELEQRVREMEKTWTMLVPSPKVVVPLSPIYGLYPHPLIDPLHAMPMVASKAKPPSANAIVNEA